jgi:hypothetical protein
MIKFILSYQLKLLGHQLFINDKQDLPFLKGIREDEMMQSKPDYCFTKFNQALGV